MEPKALEDLVRRAKVSPGRTALLAIGVLVLAVLGAYWGGYFSQLGSNSADSESLRGKVLLDRSVAEQELIRLALMATFSPDAANNLRLLAEAGLISDPSGAIGRLSVETPSLTHGLSVRIASADGSAGAIDLAQGQTAKITWQSQNATACTVLTPGGSSGIALSGTMELESSHPWYPVPGSVRAISLSCTDGVNTATDVVLFQRQAND